MKVEIKVPAMGESISSATVGTILKPSGSKVTADEEILELETEKVNQVLYAPDAGTLTLTVQPQQAVKIGDVVGYVETTAEKAEKTAPPTLPKPAPGGKSAEPGARLTKEAFVAGLQETKKPASEPEKAAQVPQAQPTPQAQPAPKPAEGERRETRRKMSKVRQVIAERLVKVQQSTASLTTFNEVDMSQVMLLREKYKDLFEKQYNVRLGFMSFFVKAVVAALEAYPDFNSYIDGDEIVHREYYDIGVAVGTEKGVFVPVVRDCERLSYHEIEKFIAESATKAKEGAITIEELQGGGFTITNGGTYGSLLSTPILNPPQAAILGMHKIEKRPVVVDDQIVIRPMMYLALTYDHRLVDGKDAVTFLVHIKNMLEDPARQVLHV